METVPPARESYVPVGGARLFARELGEGPPIIVLHGGPEFDHRYLLPELDRLAGSFRLVYYDQRGRGRSAAGVRPQDMTLASELEDIEAIRRRFGLERTAVLGHSWGGLLAMEYAVRHPDRVSHLVLLNTAPASHADAVWFRGELRARRAPGEAEAMEALAAGDRYRRGDPDAEAEYLRLHFRTALHDPRHLETIVDRLRESFTPETVLKARAIWDRLYEETWQSEHYDLHPLLRELDVPALVLHGADDFIPVEIATRVADSIPNALLTVLPECGHFSYLERPEAVQRSVRELFARG